MRVQLIASKLFALSLSLLLGCGTEPTPSDIETDCAGVPGGSARVDTCATALGAQPERPAAFRTAMRDFDGTATLDLCDRCVGGNTGLEPCEADCNGDYNVSVDDAAYIDECDTCVGGQTGLSPCIIDCNGDQHASSETAAYIDACGRSAWEDSPVESLASETVTMFWAGMPLRMPAASATTTRATTISITQTGRLAQLIAPGSSSAARVVDACGVCDDDPSNDNTVFPSGQECPLDCRGIANGPIRNG